MSVYGLWYGGPSYSHPDYTDRELFTSIEAAVKEFAYRASNTDRYYPDVTDSEMYLYGPDPALQSDPIPYLRLSVGPRGGIIRERV